MTTLTYRGVTYTPKAPTKLATAIELTYRGISYIRQPLQSVQKTAGDMVYRGVAYRKGPNGPIVLHKETTFVPTFGASIAT
ncbi:MAG: DUF4278 domain-containing protein [Pseudomonadota bacterium]